MSTTPDDTTVEDRHRRNRTGLWSAIHALGVAALLVAGFVLVSRWYSHGETDRVAGLNVLAWTVVGAASTVQLLLKPVRESRLLSYAMGAMGAGAFAMLASHVVAGEEALVSLRIAAIAAFVLSLALHLTSTLTRGAPR